jgi:hypothetical protein
VTALWVAVLHISEKTAQKITSRHQLDPEDVRSVIVCQAGLLFTWDDDEERGRRAIVQVHVGRRRVLVVLYPTLDPLGDAWHLGSAYPVD